MIPERSSAPVETPDATDLQEETGPKSAPVQWGLAKRLLFRFVCAYFFLYIFPFPLDYVPYVDAVAQQYQILWNLLVPWVGKHVFQTEINVFPNGSGDTTFNYVQLFCFLVLAAIATLVWSLLDKKRSNYARLHEWLRIYLRFALGAAMVSYGAYKVIPSQFPAPSMDRLMQPIGDASPMGILWTFIGASRSYEFFSGAAEMLGGLLLIARRTTLLGALVSIGVLSNIVMLNFSYDVPVKLYSVHLLLMAVILVLPDARRLANLFLFNRAAEPAEIRPLFRRVWLNRVGLAVRTLVLVGVTGLALYQSYDGYVSYGELAAKSPLYGIWNVDELEIDGKARPLVESDGTRWRRAIFDYPGTIAFQNVNDSRERYFLNLDDKKRVLELTKRDDPKAKSTLSYRHAGPGLLALEGTFYGHKLRAKLHRAKMPKFRLVERGFHWINEYPFNR